MSISSEIFWGVLTPTFLVLSLSENWFSVFRGDSCGNQLLNTAHLRTHVVASWLELAQQSGVADYLLFATWYAVGTMSLTFLDMSSEQRSAAANCQVYEEILMAFQVQEIVDRGLFVALDSTEEGIRKTAQEAFGIDPEKGGLHTNENWPRS